MSFKCGSLSAGTCPTAFKTPQLESSQKVLTTIAAVVAVILAAIGTVGLLHAHGLIYQLPHSLQWIASAGLIGHSVMLGSAGGLILLVFCSAVYCRNRHTQKENPAVVTPEPVAENPSICELLNNSLNRVIVMIDPNPGEALPPTKSCPFPTVKFALTVENNDGKWLYNLPCARFETPFKDGCTSLVGKFSVGDKLCVIRLYSHMDQNFELDAHILDENINRTAKSAGYITLGQAYDLQLKISNGTAARYFKAEHVTPKITFEIPGLQSVTYQQNVATFTRDPTISLVSREQIRLLQSNAEFKNVGDQLASPQWIDTTVGPIESLDQNGNKVVVTYDKYHSC